MSGKMLKCGMVVPGCDYVMHGKDETEILAKAADHARTAHGVQHISDALREKVKAAIIDERPAS